MIQDKYEMFFTLLVYYTFVQFTGDLLTYKEKKFYDCNIIGGNNMESQYAFVAYTDNIMESDINVRGEIVQLVHPLLKGQIDLVSVPEYKRLVEDFPDRIKGKVIDEQNLMNMINYCYGELKDTATRLAVDNDRIRQRLDYFESEFISDGILKPDHDDIHSVMDLANKYSNFQWEVREAQAMEHHKGRAK